jgi:NTE family protein
MLGIVTSREQGIHMSKDGTNTADIVLEGGGVKGVGLVGALEVFNEVGFSFERVAGTSAGAIVGAAVAAGMPMGDLVEVMRTVDYKKFRDRGLLDKLPGGRLASLVFEGGIYEGDYLVEFLDELLGELGVSTFGDLRLPDDPDSTLPEHHRYKLVVCASDVSQKRLVRLPWDYASSYHLDPDSRKISEAVRASMSLPFFFEPARLDYEVDGEATESVLVDGGMLSNFPIGLFDRTDGGTPRWPTFGLKLSAKPEDKRIHGSPDNPVELGRAMIATLTTFHDAIHTDRAEVRGRTVFIDTLGIDTTNFDITREEQDALYQSGRSAAQKFLDTWSFDTHVQDRTSA